MTESSLLTSLRVLNASLCGLHASRVLNVSEMVMVTLILSCSVGRDVW